MSKSARTPILFTLLFSFLFILLLVCSASAGKISVLGTPVDENITILDIDTLQIRAGDEQVQELYDTLALFPALQEVHMYNARLSEKSMDLLFDGYPDIFFGWTLRFFEHTVRTDATAFSTLHNNNPQPTHTQQTFRQLRFCKNLLALDVGHNSVTDVSFLQELPNLRVLIIAVNHYLYDLSPLAVLTDLEYLELFSTGCSDLSFVSGMTKLRDLNIAYTRVADLGPLYDLPSLKRLWGYHTKTTAEDQQALMAHRPEVEYDWKSQPTGGTWRINSHYDTIYTMFRAFEYRPFED